MACRNVCDAFGVSGNQSGRRRATPLQVARPVSLRCLRFLLLNPMDWSGSDLALLRELLSDSTSLQRQQLSQGGLEALAAGIRRDDVALFIEEEHRGDRAD